MGTDLSNKYGQKLIDTAKTSTTYAIKTDSKRAIQKTAEATGDSIGKKISDKVTNISKKSSELFSMELPTKNNETNDETETPKERNISRKKTTNY